jgi:adenine-specific DNA-methyltransferase
MAQTRKIKKPIETRDYRHIDEKRKNVPLAKIASEGEVPRIKKVRYYYSPHLSPQLQFDPEGKPDHLTAVSEKVAQYLTKREKVLLEKAVSTQQPWLEWAEKKEHYDRSWFEVDPVALHIHERVSAQAIVRAAMREDLQRSLFADPQLPYQKEVQFYQHDVDWANRLILGDSLQVMSSLAFRENLGGKVQVIYIDPPYGIRYGSNFQPFVGKKSVSDAESDLTREPEMVKAYRDTWNLGVHSYLSYLYDRLVLSRDLLSETGSIFMQISDENVHRVRVLLDEVYGPENFVSVIPFRKTSGAGSISGATKTIASVCDYLIWYAKDISKIKYRQLFLPKEYGSEGASQYTWIERRDGFRRRIKSTDDISSLLADGHKIFGADNMTSSSGVDTTRFEVAFEGKTYRPHPGVWKTGAEGMPRLFESNRLVRSGENIWYVRYLEDFPARPLSNLWEDTISSFLADKRYVVQTNTKVIQRCILMTSDPGDLVLDPTCGSGTTAFLCEQWGRRWITIDSSRVALALARQRLLTACFDYFRLRDDQSGVSSGFKYSVIPHITLKSIAQNQNLDSIFDRHRPILSKALEACNKALNEMPDKIISRLRSKLLEKAKNEGKSAITEADNRRWALPHPGIRWEHWEVPYDTDPDWSKDLQDAVIAYRRAMQIKMGEVNACIAANVDQEELVDHPEIVKGIVRVSGPFTVEGVRPEEVSIGNADNARNADEGGASEDMVSEVQNLRAYLSRMIELIRKDGITFPNNQHQEFARVEPLYEETTGTLVHAEAIWKKENANEANNIGITFGPQFGPVTAEQVGDIIRAGRRYDELIIAGFSFDAAALDSVQENQHPRQKIHIAHIRPDISPGMDGLLKDTPKSQLFTVFGNPEIKVKKVANDEYTVELLGVDIYDPLNGEVRSTKAEKVAAWFLDSDYDGRCFCINQAFFPDQNAWEKIAKSLGSQADVEAFKALNGTISIPFKIGQHKRVAAKVIDPRGNEVMAIAKLETDN